MLFIALGRVFYLDQNAFESLFLRLPLWFSGMFFVLLYVGLTFFIWVGPKDVLRIAAALAFGPYISTLLVWVAEAINVVVLFNMSRRLGRDYVGGRLKGRMLRVERAVSESGFWSIFFLKLTPVVPLRFLDLGFGLTGISFKKYWTISALATPLRIFFLQFFLALGVEMIMDPSRLQTYLYSHPFIFRVTTGYLLLSVVMMFVVKGRGNSSSGKRVEQGQS